MRVCLRHIYNKVYHVFKVVTSVLCNTHQVCATALYFLHVTQCLLAKVALSKNTDYKCSIFNQANGSVF